MSSLHFDMCKVVRILALAFLLPITLMTAGGFVTVAHAEKVGGEKNSTPSQAAPVTTFAVNGYRFEGNTLFSEAELAQVTAPYKGAGKSFAAIEAACEAIQNHYIAAGYPIIQAFAPQQNAEGGIIKLVLIEGRVSRILISENRFHSDDNILYSVPRLKVNELPQVKRIVSDLALANENPSKRLALNMRQGEQAGAVIAELSANDERTKVINLSVDNGGSQSAQHRATASYENYNLFDVDHTLTLQYSTTLEHPKRSQNYSTGYRIPFYSLGLSLEAVAAVSNSASGTTITPNGPFEFTGKGTILGLHVSQPLASIGEYRQRMFYGIDYKDFDNSCAASGITQDQRVCGTITTRPIMVGYFGQINTPTWQASGNLSYAHNWVGGPHGKRENFEFDAYGNATDRKAAWDLWRGTLSLGLPFANSWQFSTVLNGQYSRHLLVSGEQFGIGGAGSVRGYNERSLAGDSGYNGNIEMQTPPLALTWASVLAPADVRFAAFHDFGNIHVRTSPGAEGYRQTIRSYGLGLRLSALKNLTVKADAGVAMTPLQSSTDGVSRARGDVFVHTTIIMSF